MPRPVHSALRRVSSSAAADAAAPSVELRTSTAIESRMHSGEAEIQDVGVAAWEERCERIGGRGWNQLLLKSKKQRSDQLHEVRKRMRSRKLQ
jgi:hypothetical protein